MNKLPLELKLEFKHSRVNLKCVKSKRLVSQAGTVLIIALLIVAVITGLAIDFSSRFQLSLSRAENRFFTNQMQQSLLSIEHASVWVLKDDKKKDANNGNKNYDFLEEDWAKAEQYQQLIQAEFGDVLINAVSLEDAQGRFNVNQLKTRPKPYDAGLPFEMRYTAQEKRFIRLLQTVPNDVVPSDAAEEITHAVIDWLDEDNSVTGAGGAESDYYLSQDEPFRASNNLLMSISELRLIKGITEEIYEHIAPLTVALPDDQAFINVNTALPEVMRTLNAKAEVVPISEEDSNTLESSRPVKEKSDPENTENANLNSELPKKEEGFTKIEDFLDSNEVGTVFGSDPELQPDPSGLTTGSNYFLLSAELEINDVVRRGFSLLKRDVDNKTNQTRVRVVRRGSEDIF